MIFNIFNILYHKCYKDNLKMCQEMKLHLEKAQCYCDIGMDN